MNIENLKKINDNNLLNLIRVEILFENNISEVLKKEFNSSLIILEKSFAKIQDKKINKNSAYIKCFATPSSCIAISEMLSFKKINIL